MSSSGGSLIVFNEAGFGSNRPVRASHKDRKYFMSSRASDIFKGVSTPQSRVGHNDDDRDEFNKILKEAEELGASQLSWKARKEWEAKKLLALGAKTPKSHKMPIAMGRNIKRKRDLFEEQTRLQVAGTGLSRARSSSKKKPFSRSVEDRGLRASQGIFKGGVLHVKPLPKKFADSNSKKNMFGGIFNDGKKSQKSKKKSKKQKRKHRK